jgi:hypothetical protein
MPNWLPASSIRAEVSQGALVSNHDLSYDNRTAERETTRNAAESQIHLGEEIFPGQRSANAGRAKNVAQNALARRSADEDMEGARWFERAGSLKVREKARRHEGTQARRRPQPEMPQNAPLWKFVSAGMTAGTGVMASAGGRMRHDESPAVVARLVARMPRLREGVPEYRHDTGRMPVLQGAPARNQNPATRNQQLPTDH